MTFPHINFLSDACSTDHSTESNTKSSRKSSRSYVSSSSSKSGQATTINFSFEEIYKATENFSPANIIGEGGSGSVYKGKLKDGSIVAVKRARKVNNLAIFSVYEFYLSLCLTMSIL